MTVVVAKGEGSAGGSKIIFMSLEVPEIYSCISVMKKGTWEKYFTLIVL